MPREPLEAILLVGGKGTRLRPLTLSAPKPLLPTAGVPFLRHQFARAAAAGVTHVVLATSYRAEMFREAFGDGSALGLSIDYVYEEVPLGTGGGIRNAASLLHGGPDDPVVVLNGDVLSGHDLGEQLDVHRKADAAVTLHLVEVPDPAAFGCVPTDPSGRVTAFLEKTPNPVTNRINAGCYVFTRSVIDAIPADRPVSVERETFPGLIEGGRTVMGYIDTAYWLDVGTPAAFVQGSCDLVLGTLASSALPGPTGAGPGPAGRVRGGRRHLERRHHRGGRVADRRGRGGGRQRAVRRRAGGPGRGGPGQHPRRRRPDRRGRRHRRCRHRRPGRHRRRQRAGSRPPGLARRAPGPDVRPVLLRRLTWLLRRCLRTRLPARFRNSFLTSPAAPAAPALQPPSRNKPHSPSVRAPAAPRALEPRQSPETPPRRPYQGQEPLVRDWRAPFPIRVRLTLSVHGRGGGDPTYRVDPAGAVWRTSLTPEGPATLRVLPERGQESRPRPGARERPGCWTRCRRCSVPPTSGTASTPARTRWSASWPPGTTACASAAASG